MKKHIRQGLTVALAAVLFLCSGCSLDVEQFLQPPKTQGEQQAVHTALETYIRDSGQANSHYTLCYPVEGEHTAAFVLCDAAGKPLENTRDAALALAFYSMSAIPSDTHINLLRREGDEWVSVADTVGASANILQVAFGDLDGDGTAELLTGWDTYNSRDHHLTVFSLSQGLQRLSEDRVYNSLFVGDLTADGQDSLLLLRIMGDEVTATLETMQSGRFVSLGQVFLDAEIQQFNTMTLCRLSQGVHGLYIDAVKGTDTAVTELVYYDNSGLHAPLCNQAGKINTATARPTGFKMRDVDGDAQIEIPLCTLLATHITGDTTPEYAYRTDWMTWDYTAQELREKMSTVVNATDGYLVVLSESMRDTVTTTYVESERVLTLLHTQSQQPILRLRPIAQDRDAAYTTLFKATDAYEGCEVWYDSEQLDIDTVRYMVLRLSE